MNYQLTQTGEQVQDILNQAPTTEETLQAEITRSTNKDDALELAIGNEKTRAEGVESNLQTAIGNEITRAEGAEVNLQTAIGNEKTRAELVEGALRTDVDGINAKIPASASSENKLATESFVNSSISTNTADFKGTYTSLEQLQTEVHDANANDYAFVISTDATGNTAYNRYKYVEGTGWVFEYALNNSSFTSAQWAAINSAITAALVAKLTGLPTATELTTQLNAIIDSVATEKSRAEGIESGLRTDVNANATAIGTEKTRAEGVEGTLSTAIGNEKTRAEGAELVLQQNINAEALLRGNADTTLQTAIDGINAKIPAAASASNQLADKTFVNSSIATNTATFRGTYNSVAALDEVTADNNDYAFVVATDTAGNTIYNRYKYVEGSGWVFEYALNNSSFTATQWAAVNSGITAALVTKLDGLPDNTALTAMFTAITSLIPAAATSDNKLVDYAQLVAGLATKQNTLTFDNVPTENSSNPVKSGGVYMAIATVTAAVVGLQSSKQDVLTFDQYPTAGSNNPVKSTGIYTAIENAVAPKADKTDLDNAVIRISTNEVDIAQLQAAYRGLTQNDVVPVAPTDTWPVANPQENVIYRVADRTNTPPQYYTDYMWNGTVMVEMAQYDNAIDSRPKKDSQNLVTSGGVFDNIGALDVSELNATENPHTLATYVDLSAALAAIPSDYQKGGMSIKFVQSSDNKYVQYRLMADSWSTTPSDWQGVDNTPTAGSKNLVQSGGVSIFGLRHPGSISNGNWAYVDKTTHYHYILEVTPDFVGLPFALKVGSYTGVVAFLNDYSPINGQPAGVIGSVLTVSSTKSGKIPEGTKYIYVLEKANVNNSMLSKMEINGVDLIKGNQYVSLSGIVNAYRVRELNFRLFSLGSLPNVDSNANTLTFYNETLIVIDNTSYTIPANTVVNLEISGTVYSTILFRKSDSSFVTVARTQSFNPIDTILFGFAVTGGSNTKKRYWFPFNYTVDGSSEDTSDILNLNPDAEVLTKLRNLKTGYVDYGSSANYPPVLSLLHFSDLHGDNTNLLRIKEFVTKYASLIGDVIQTGDLIPTVVTDGVPADWSTVPTWLSVIGNHDATIKVDNVWTTVSPQQSYEAVIAPYVSNWGVVQPSGAGQNNYYPCYYYKDYTSSNVRLIVVDNMKSYGGGPAHWDATQKAWFENTLADARTNNLHVVVGIHYPPFATVHNSNIPFDSLMAHPDESIWHASNEIPNAVKSFIDAGGKFVCYLSGHTHCDYFGVGQNFDWNNQLCIGIAAASSYAGSGIYGDGDRTVGTKGQDCFNIVGIDTTSKVVKLVRIGLEYDKFLRRKNTLSWDYENGQLIYCD